VPLPGITLCRKWGRDTRADIPDRQWDDFGANVVSRRNLVSGKRAARKKKIGLVALRQKGGRGGREGPA